MKTNLRGGRSPSPQDILPLPLGKKQSRTIINHTISSSSSIEMSDRNTQGSLLAFCSRGFFQVKVTKTRKVFKFMIKSWQGTGIAWPRPTWPVWPTKAIVTLCIQYIGVDGLLGIPSVWGPGAVQYFETYLISWKLRYQISPTSEAFPQKYSVDSSQLWDR